VVRRSHLTIALILALLVALGASIALFANLQEERTSGEDGAGLPDQGQERTPSVGEESPPEFEIGLIGDIPYTAEEERKTEDLFGEMDSERLSFIIHIGDIKSGSAPCTDELFIRERERFDSSAHPLFYVPGDNEWTDCGRTGYDPLERLERLREIFFEGDESLGQEKIPLTRQGTDYPENVHWSYGGVTFVGLNVPGPNNNYEGTSGEYESRNEANLEWLRKGFERAVADKSSALMVFFQANPGFELSPEEHTGYNDLLAALEEETVTFAKPVVLVHGDTHIQRIDRPMTSSTSGERVENFTRVETFGSPEVGWVRAGVDTSDPEVFTFRPETIEDNTDQERP
jgi:predicted phosphodiesterase